MKPKYLLIVKVPRGIVVRDRPAPESQGAVKMRAEGVGKALYAYTIVNVDGVNYAGLIPQNPSRPEWVRVAERDGSIEYVEIIPLEDNIESEIITVLNRIANALEGLRK